MPYIENQNDDEEKQQGQPDAAAPLSISYGQSAAPGQPTPGAAPIAGQQASQSAGQAPGRYTNFQQYFDANKDAATASGNKLAGGLEARGNQVQAETARRTSDFANAANQGTGAAAGTVGTTSTAPDSRGLGPTQKSGEKGAPAGTPPPAPPPSSAPPAAPIEYKGPNSLAEGSGWNELVSRAKGVQNEAQQTASSEGLQALLQKDNGAATQGGSRLDAGLLNATSGGRFAKLRDAFGGLPATLSKADLDARNIASKGKGMVGNYNAENAKAAADKQAAIEATVQKMALPPPAQRDPAKAGKSDFDEYNKWRQESAVNSVLNFLDPTWYAKQLGITKDWSLNDNASKFWEKNITGGDWNSQHVNTTAFDPQTTQMWPEVYNDLSSDEVAALEKMNINEQIQFIRDRYTKIKPALDAAKAAQAQADWKAGKTPGVAVGMRAAQNSTAQNEEDEDRRRSLRDWADGQ